MVIWSPRGVVLSTRQNSWFFLAEFLIKWKFLFVEIWPHSRIFICEEFSDLLTGQGNHEKTRFWQHRADFDPFEVRVTVYFKIRVPDHQMSLRRYRVSKSLIWRSGNRRWNRRFHLQVRDHQISSENSMKLTRMKGYRYKKPRHLIEFLTMRILLLGMQVDSF